CFLVQVDGASLRCVPVEKGFRVSAAVVAAAAEFNWPAPPRLGPTLTFPVEAVASATLEPLSPWNGPGVAAWRLTLQDGKTYHFRIRSVEELDFADLTLAGVLGDRFENRLAG